jgi:hypothetical protein
MLNMKKPVTCEKCGGIKAGTERWYTPAAMICCGHPVAVGELEEIFAGELSVNDRLLILDTDKKQSKQVKIGELIKFMGR